MTRRPPAPPGTRRFARRFGPSLRPVGFRLEPAPWLDLLLLLFFLTLSLSAMVRRPGLEIELPPAPFSGGAPMNARVLTITQEGFLFFDEQRTPMDGLASLFQQIAHEDPETPLLIEADPRIAHGVLTDLYTKASAAGLRRVILATRLPPPPDLAP